jgi:hypothetical protein
VPQPATTADALPDAPARQRRLAEWLKAKGHYFASEGFDSRSGAELPREPFEIGMVGFNDITNAQAEQFADLAAPLGTVGVLYLNALDTDFDVDGLRQMTRLASLTRFAGELGAVKAPDLALLAVLSKLHELNFSNCRNFDDEVVATVKQMKTVDVLWLNNCPITNAGVAQLKEMPQLKSVWLNTQQLSDDIWESLAQLPKLESLTVFSTPNLIGRGIAKLSALPLAKLELSGADYSDYVLREVAMLPLLEGLSIHDVPISDLGLAHLAGTALTSVELRRTQVTREGVEKLRKALPQCKIEWAEGRN